MTTSSQLVALTIRLSDEEHENLTQLAAVEQRSLGFVARQAIKEYLAAHAKRSPA